MYTDLALKPFSWTPYLPCVGTLRQIGIRSQVLPAAGQLRPDLSATPRAHKSETRETQSQEGNGRRLRHSQVESDYIQKPQFDA